MSVEDLYGCEHLMLNEACGHTICEKCNIENNDCTRCKDIINKFKEKQQKETFPEFNVEGLGKGKGLKNLLNMCYVNTAVQCLSSVPSLYAYLTSNRFTECSLGKEYSKLLKDMNSNQNRYSISDADQLKYYVSKIATQFDNEDQNDVSDFLSNLINGLNEELKDENRFKTNGFTVIEEMFYGSNFNTYKCKDSKCKYQFQTTDPFLFLCVPNIRAETLEDAITSQTKAEDAEWPCEYCHKLCSLTVSFERLPDILLIRLKTTDYADLRYRVDDMMILSEDGNGMTNFKQYKLIAIGNHVGNNRSGHYTAYCLRGNEWYSYQDEHVSSVSCGTALASTKSALILIYMKM